MPAGAWPGSVQRYGYRPAFLNVTRSVVRLPAAICAVFLPPTLKSCEILPLFTIVKTTVPFLAVFGRSANLNSVALTVTLGGVTVCLDGPANAATATTSAAGTTRAAATRAV